MQTNAQIIRQNNIIEVYFQVNINCKQNNWAKFLLLAEFLYNNVKNMNTNHIIFKFYYKYYLYNFFKKKNKFILKILTSQQTQSRAKKMNDNLLVKPTLCPKIAKKNL